MFFHLYYLPIIPTRGRRRHHKTCPKCNVYQEFDPEAYDQVTQSMKDHAADALVALHSGDSEFLIDGDESGEPAECVGFLHGAFDWLYAAGEKEFCDGLIQQLSSPETKYAREALNGVLETMRGKLKQAIDSFESAASQRPDAPYAYQQLGHLLVLRKRRPEAVEAYKKALACTPKDEERLGLLVQLVDEQMATKQFAEAAATYDEIERISPEIAADKTIQKGRKKARKKAGLA